MATITTMNMLLPPPPAFNRYSRASTHLDTQQQLAERFWKAVKLDSPTSPTFDASLHSSPVDEKVMCAIHIDDTAMTFIDDPIVAFETLDCYSPDRPTFTSTTTYNKYIDEPMFEPCPYGEPPDLSCCTSPAPTLGSIRFHDKPPSRTTSPWSAMTLRPTRFRKPSPSPNHRRPPSVLALASAFLDSIVRLARSRNSTPTTFNDGAGPVTILESEVLINVLEDGKRAGLHGTSTALCGVERALEKLEIPPLSAVTGSFWDPASPVTSTEGPATSSQELDAMGKVDWERQLTGTKAHGFEGERGRDLWR